MKLPQPFWLNVHNIDDIGHAQLNVQTSGGKNSILLNEIMGEVNEWKVI